jgi:hypothetical protein
METLLCGERRQDSELLKNDNSIFSAPSGRLQESKAKRLAAKAARIFLDALLHFARFNMYANLAGYYFK